MCDKAVSNQNSWGNQVRGLDMGSLLTIVFFYKLLTPVRARRGAASTEGWLMGTIFILNKGSYTPKEGSKWVCVHRTLIVSGTNVKRQLSITDTVS